MRNHAENFFSTFKLTGTDPNNQRHEFTLDTLLQEKKPILFWLHPIDNKEDCPHAEHHCAFRDSLITFASQVLIVSICSDPIELHEKIRNRYHIPAYILSDPNHDYFPVGNWSDDLLCGHPCEGWTPSLYFTDIYGIIRHVWGSASATHHTNDLVHEINSYLITLNKVI